MHIYGKSETHDLTGSAPTLDTQGLVITNAEGVSCVVSAPSGQTITGGTLLCYYQGPVSISTDGVITRRWMRFAANDITPATSQRDAASGDFQIPVGAGRISWVPSSITLSGAGSTVTVTIVARRKD